MAAASSTNATNSSQLSSSSHDPVLTGIVTPQIQSSQLILGNTPLPPATTLRGNNNNSSMHSITPSTTSTIHNLSSGEIVPLIIHHHHHHHHHSNNELHPHHHHHHHQHNHDIRADSSTLIDNTASSIITTTTANNSDIEHQHSMMSLLDDHCTPIESTTTTILMQATSSTTINNSEILKATPTPSSHNNNTILFQSNNNNNNNNNDPIIGGGGGRSISDADDFLQQCSSNHINSISDDNRVIVNQSSPITTISNSSDNNNGDVSVLHNISNVICGGSDIVDVSMISLNNIVNNDQQQLQLQLNDKSCSTDNLNLNISNDDSLSSAESDDIELNDIKLDESGGYQDNTSSNSQQSAGGGSVSGGGNGGGSGGNGSNSYASLIQPSSIGQSGIGGHTVAGSNLSGIGGSGIGTGGHGVGIIGGPTSVGGGHHNHGIGSGQSGGGNGGVGGSSGGGVHQASGSEQTDFKYLFEELCPVCGDKVSGYHYGLLTCESCKGFFKRTVQNKKVYTCVAERRCLIDKTQRKRCPYCRFQKCLDVGMKLEAVRADRMRGGRNKFGPMYKRDRARKLQMMRQRQLALQAIRGSMSTADIKPGQISPTGYQQSYPSMNIKQEIQIPQVSSLTQSPDSSPSPIAIALGQVNPSTAIIATTLSGSSSGPGSTNTTTVSGAGGGSASCGPGSDNGSSSLQHSSDSKICFDSGTNPSSTADAVSTVELRVSPMIREFVQSVDDREWQTQLFTLLQKQSYNQVEVDLFELMCKVLDQNLFSQVDWARNTVFFKDLKVDDQMKLLQHSWSDMLVLDHLHQRIHNGLPDETPLHNGQIFNLLGLGLLGVPQLGDYFNELQNKLQELKFDMGDYVCMKFLILLNPNCTDVRGIINRKTVLEGHENVQAALLDYTLTCYPSVTDKFSRLLNILPEIHAMATRGEEHLYLKHCAGSAPTQTLLMEMLHAKRKV